MLGVKGIDYIELTEENLMRMNVMSNMGSDDSESNSTAQESDVKFSDTKIIEKVEHEFQESPHTEDPIEALILGDFNNLVTDLNNITIAF